MSLKRRTESFGAIEALRRRIRSMALLKLEDLQQLLALSPDRIHEVAVDLFRNTGNMDNLEYEYRHKAIIEKFGRYPHRNKVLGRQSTAEEIEFLAQHGSSF